MRKIRFKCSATIAAGIGAALSQDQAIGANLYFRDFSGLPSIMFQMRAALRQIDPHSGGQFALTIGGQAPARRFLWPGLHWDAVQLAARLAWIGLASAAALLAALFFHRFDPAREPRMRVRRQAGESLLPESLPRTAGDAPEAIAWSGRLTPVGPSASGRRFVRPVAAELELMMKGQRWWWYAVAAGLFVACLAAPLEVSRGEILVAAWLWPILLWSRMGSREARCATESLVFSCPHTLWCQLPAAWLAGVMVALLIGEGVGIRLLLAADARGLAAWTAGALFIPTLAMALGLASRNSKLFEALYTVWWYVGALHHIPGLDYMGTTPASSRPVTFCCSQEFFCLPAILRAAFNQRPSDCSGIAGWSSVDEKLGVISADYDIALRQSALGAIHESERTLSFYTAPSRRCRGAMWSIFTPTLTKSRRLTQKPERSYRRKAAGFAFEITGERSQNL